MVQGGSGHFCLRLICVCLTNDKYFFCIFIYIQLLYCTRYLQYYLVPGMIVPVPGSSNSSYLVPGKVTRYYSSMYLVGPYRYDSMGTTTGEPLSFITPIVPGTGTGTGKKLGPTVTVNGMCCCC